MTLLSREALRRLLHEVRLQLTEVDDALEQLLAHCREGVAPSEPDTPAPSLLGAIGHLLRRLS